MLSSFRAALAKGLLIEAKANEEPDAANGFEPKTEAPPKGLEVRRAAAEDDVGMANGFDVAEKGVDAKGLTGADAANGFEPKTEPPEAPPNIVT